VASIQDEQRRVMVAYLTTAGVANAASLSLSDLEYHYWYLQNGNALPVVSTKTLTELRRQKYGATPGQSTTEAERAFYSATATESLADAALRYWTAL
jgi:hypothetical protein